MAPMRCPYHDIVFETETDSSKPGTRELGDDNKPTGKHKHPLYAGGISGHTDCPLCKKGVKVAQPRGEAPVDEPAAASGSRRIA